MYTDLLYAVCTAREAQGLPSGVRPAVFSHLISPEGVLMRRGELTGTAGGVAVLSSGGSVGDAEQCARVLLADIKRLGFTGLLADFESVSDSSRVLARAIDACLYESRTPFFVTAGLETDAVNALVLENASVTAGSYELRLRELRARYSDRLAADIEPVRMDFTLPSAGTGDVISPARLSELLNDSPLTYFSHDLCARYFTYVAPGHVTHFVVYDDEASYREKLRTAAELGISSVFTPYAAIRDILPGVVAD